MIHKLWQRLVIWYGLRYNRWPRGWYDASDVTWTSVTGDGEWESFPVTPHGGDITILPDPDANEIHLWYEAIRAKLLYSGPAVVPEEPLDGIARLRKRLDR